jgi:hypothetical protein
MSIHKLSAESGYDCLTCQVAALDATEKGHVGLALRDFSINTRRRRIAAIHNEIHKLIKPCEYVFLIEDDGALPPDALSRLLADYKAHPYAGFHRGGSAREVGIPMIGAWRADDVYEPSVIETALPARPELLNDAGRAIGCVPGRRSTLVGCVALAKYEHYLRHECRPFDGDALGPDFNWGIELRRQGYIGTMSTTQ